MERADLVRIWQEIDALKVVRKGWRMMKEMDLWTKHDHQLIVKRFFRWFRNEEFAKGFKVKESGATVGPEAISTPATTLLSGLSKGNRKDCLGINQRIP